MEGLYPSNLWGQVLEVIKKELNPQSFQTWFGPTKQVSQDEHSIQVEVPNQFFKDWLIDHYLNLLSESIKTISGRPLAIELLVSQKQEEPQAPKRFSLFPKRPKEEKETLELNPKFTFESFVVGSCNRFAHAASLAVAESPAKSYNPLFIYGGVGLGKTHLMQAVGQSILNKYNNFKMLYVSSEKFTNQLIDAIQNRSTLKFREKFRGLDVLLIDDIQFIAGKESTQEAFFHTFNALYDAHKQIVLTSDRPPQEIPTLEKRLVSRFEWGLIADMQPPDLETRIAILKKKAEIERISVPNDVMFFIGDKIRSNIRQLEGALIRVSAYSSLMGNTITVELAKNVLKDMMLEEIKNVSIDLIQKKVAEYFDIRLSDMKAKKRNKAIAYARQIAMYLARELTGHSLTEIGDYFGGKDHTTVLYACNKIQEELKNSQGTKDTMNRLVGIIKEIR